MHSLFTVIAEVKKWHGNLALASKGVIDCFIVPIMGWIK